MPKPTNHLPKPAGCINRFCGRGKTFQQLQDCIAILKDPKSDRRKVLCSPTVMLLMEWCGSIRDAVGEEIFKKRCGRLFNVTSEQINNMSSLLGPNHSSVKMARALKESSKSPIFDDWSVIITTHATGWSRINSLGEEAEVFFDEIPIDCCTFHDVTDESEYTWMKNIREANLKHAVFRGAKGLAKQVQEGRLGLHFYTHGVTAENGPDKITNHCIQFWDLSFPKVRSITFCSAMADMTFLKILGALNNIEIEGLSNLEADVDMRGAIDLFTFRSMTDDLSLRCSKAAHYREEDDKKAEVNKEKVRSESGFMVGFRKFESELDRNVRFGLAGMNTLSDVTTAGIDGLPRFAPSVVSGIKSVLGKEAEGWMKDFCFQSVVQSLWRGSPRKGEKMDVWVWSEDVPNLFARAKGGIIRVHCPTKVRSFMGTLNI